MTLEGMKVESAVVSHLRGGMSLVGVADVRAVVVRERMCVVRGLGVWMLSGWDYVVGIGVLYRCRYSFGGVSV